MRKHPEQVVDTATTFHTPNTQHIVLSTKGSTLANMNSYTQHTQPNITKINVKNHTDIYIYHDTSADNLKESVIIFRHGFLSDISDTTTALRDFNNRMISTDDSKANDLVDILETGKDYNKQWIQSANWISLQGQWTLKNAAASLMVVN